MAEFAAPASETGRSLEAAARDGRRSGTEAASLRRTASAGLAGASAPYPHGDRIRRAFGQYAPAGLRAHMGPAAMAAAGRMNAAAFVLDGRAAFAGRPSLHTAAHEAAHLAHHERGGAALRHGVGALGDRHEALADRVADAVAAGRSAEPLLAASLSASPAPAGPMLQMAMNKITGQSFTTPPSPWTEIQSQLPFTDPDAGAKLVKAVPIDILQGPFTRMVQTLKASCDRAGSVTASINGTRNGGSRGGDATQTAYGTLGKLEGYLNEAMPGPKENYEGGHLISDQILGIDSYVQFNFAPQQRPFNSPFYRAIEKIGHEGLKATRKPTPSSPLAAADATYKATVRYPTSDYKVRRTDLERLFAYGQYIGMSPSAPKAKDSPIDLPVYKPGQLLPDTLDMTPRVPSLWTVKVDTPSPDHTFSHQATITKGKAMDQAFEPKGEGHVQGLVSPGGDYAGDIRWAMDTMTVANPNAKKSWGTATATTHTFSAVQAPPRNPKAIAASSAPASGPVVAPTPAPSGPKPVMPSTSIPSPLPAPGGPLSFSAFGASTGPSHGPSAFTSPGPFDAISPPSHTPLMSSTFGSTSSSLPGFGGYNPFQTSFAPSAPPYAPPSVGVPYNPFQTSFAPLAPLQTPPSSMAPYFPPTSLASPWPFSAPSPGWSAYGPFSTPPMPVTRQAPPRPRNSVLKRDRTTHPGAQPGDSKKSRKRDRTPEAEEDDG